MDFAWDPATEAVRREVRDLLAEHLTPEVEDRLYATGESHDDAFVRALGARDWIAPEWHDGGTPLDPAHAHVMEEEFARAEAPFYAVSTATMVGRVIASDGSEELRAAILPKIARGEVAIALGMTEPEAGSDVAAVQTRARSVDDGTGWVIDGQKMFTTNAHVGRLRVPPRPHRPGQRAPSGPHDVPRAARPPGHRGAGRAHALGRAHQHHLLQRGVRRGRLAHQRHRRRLAVA